MSYAIWLQVLMEIALAVSREMEMQSLLTLSGKTYLKKLDGTLFRVYKNQGDHFEFIFGAPKSSRFGNVVDQTAATFFATDGEWDLFPTARGALYFFKLKDFGMMALMRAEALDTLFISELLPVNEMFAAHLKACETFKRQEEIEKFQRMLMQLAMKFINVEASQVDRAFNEALEAAGEFFTLDRTYVFSYDFFSGLMHNTHEWCARGVEPSIELLKDVPTEPFMEAWVKKHQRGEILLVESVEGLEKESALYEILAEQDIKSLITIPMMQQNDCLGFVGFDAVSTLKYWTENEIALLKVLAEMFTNLELKRRYERELLEAKKMAEAASLAKSNFLANMSHEIRTPLNGIVGMTYLLDDTDLNKAQKEYLKVISESIDSLLGIINNILDFSKIEAGQFKLNLESFNFEEEVFSVCNMLNKKASEKGIEWIINYENSVPKQFYGDRVRIRQILVNLIGNAVKFTHEGSIQIHIAFEEGMLCFSVMDTGIGISEKAQTRVFEQFTQEDDSSTKHYEGTGLGLAITKQLVDLMSGSISLESEIGKGSKFTVRLPLKLGDSLIEVRTTELEGLKILVVDDHLANLQIIKGYLEPLGVTSDLVINGLEALLQIEKKYENGILYDFAFIDLAMPGMDGLTLCNLIRSNGQWQGIKLIILSSIVGDRMNSESLNEITDAWLSKPFSKSMLVSTMIDLLSTHEPEAVEILSNSPLGIGNKGDKPILVVDDNEVNRMMVSHLLSKRQYVVYEACSGLDALEKVEERIYHFILMDIQMPKMDGYKATQMIRKGNSLNKETPIIAITANALEQDKKKALEMGMDGHIGKPFKLEDLLELEKMFSIEGDKALHFNESVFYEQFEGDLAFGKEIVSIFKQDLPKFMERMESAYANRDFQQISEIAHELKGASGYAGAIRIIKDCIDLMTVTSELEFEKVWIELNGNVRAYIKYVDL